MPTRLVVMLHRRRSARAGEAVRRDATKRTAAPPIPRCRARERCSADEDDPAIIDVGSRRSRGDEVAQTLKKTCRIVVIEQAARIKTEALRPRKGRCVDERAGGVR